MGANYNARHGFIAFVDESGQEGGKDNPHSSEFFVLSAVVCRTDRGGKPLTKAFAAAAKECGKGPAYRFPKFSMLKNRNQKFCILRHLGCAQMQHTVIICHKESFSNDAMLSGKDNLYYFSSQLLLERISWICRDAHFRRPSGNGKPYILFSRRNTLDYRRFQQYAEKIKTGETRYKSNAAWDYIDLKAIGSRPHWKHCDGLLASDFIASAYGAALEQNCYGLSDDYYIRPLNNCVYRPPTGKSWSNGIKVFPTGAEKSLVKNAEYWWMRELFGSPK